MVPYTMKKYFLMTMLVMMSLSCGKDVYDNVHKKWTPLSRKDVYVLKEDGKKRVFKDKDGDGQLDEHTVYGFLPCDSSKVIRSLRVLRKDFLSEHGGVEYIAGNDGRLYGPFKIHPLKSWNLQQKFEDVELMHKTNKIGLLGC